MLAQKITAKGERRKDENAEEKTKRSEKQGKNQITDVELNFADYTSHHNRAVVLARQ